MLNSNTEALVRKEKDLNSLILIELKITKKYLPDNPKGFFFVATKNEFYLAKLLGDRYKFCFHYIQILYRKPEI
ncbi:hypothetical protein ABNX05_22190 [Lysinibacillus sp. M3]|uniref:Uncharacterized protein n=1 Tax=Lysinibacillus zambalensis TaxID=3160866 RepID=A0ABV1MXV5_9BACI